MLRGLKGKTIALIAGITLLLAMVPVAYGGLSWSGLDPIVVVNGATYHVDVAVPPGQWCKIDGDIQVVFHVPSGAATTLVAEQEGPCGVTTSSSFAYDSTGGVWVEVSLSAKGNFPVQVEMSSGDNVSFCQGKARETVTCSVAPGGSDDDTGGGI